MYEKWRTAVGIDNVTMIKTLQSVFPKYSKATQSMVNNPKNYGVKLTKEAEAVLYAAYGKGEQPRRKAPKRRKANRLVVYLDDKTFKAVKAAMESAGCATSQSYLEGLIDKTMKGEKTNA